MRDWEHIRQRGEPDFTLNFRSWDRVARRVDMKEQVVDFAPQPVITKDNVTMRIDTVVFYQITDPKIVLLWKWQIRSWRSRT